MNSSIYIDGIALYVVLALMVIITFCAIMLGIGHIIALKENEELRVRNQKLETKLAKIRDRIYKETFKTPEVD